FHCSSFIPMFSNDYFIQLSWTICWCIRNLTSLMSGPGVKSDRRTGICRRLSPLLFPTAAMTYSLAPDATKHGPRISRPFLPIRSYALQDYVSPITLDIACLTAQV